MNTRNIAFALAALTTLSFSALATTSASASQFGSYGGGWGGGHGQFGGGFIGQDGPIRGSHVWRPPVKHYDPCDCLPQARPTYVPIRVPVYIPVKVPVRVEVPVPVKVPVYIPVPRPTYVSPPVHQTADPCECDETGYPHHTHQHQRQTHEHHYPQVTQMQGQPQYDQGNNLASNELEKK